MLDADTAMLANILSIFNLRWLSIPPNKDKNTVFLVVSLVQADKYSQIMSINCNSCREVRPEPRRPLRLSTSQKINSDIMSIAKSSCLLDGPVLPISNCSEKNYGYI